MKKKHLLTSMIVLFAVVHSYAQKGSNELKIYYGIIDSELLRKESLVGSGSYDNKSSYEIGFKYQRNISGKFSIETGINYMSCEVKITPAMTGITLNPEYEDLKMISVPVYANYTFGKYFFANAGPIIDFQNSDVTFDSQSGIGYGIGVGGEYKFDSFLIYVNPNFKRHSVLPFDKEEYHQKLTEFGIQFGIGYEF